jgi:putative ABC transport system substrate-binding protein
VSKANDFAQALSAISGMHAEALIVITPNPVAFANKSRLASFAQQKRLPTMYANRDFVEAGGLMSYGPNVPDLFRRAAVYVDKILKGTKPADLPVEQPTKFELVINLKTATALGLTIPQSLLVRADEVIQ